MSSNNGPYSGSNAPDYSQVLWDAGKPYYKTGNGGKLYIPPASAMSMFDNPQALAWAKQQGFEIKGGQQGLADASKGTVGPNGVTTYGPSPVTTNPESGGLLHTTGEWNPQTGQFDHSIDWGNLLSLGVAGGLTAGIAPALLGGGAAAASGAGGAGVGLGETGATAGLAGSGFGAGAGLGITPLAGVSPLVSAIGGAAPLASNAGATGIGAIAPGVDASGGVAGATGAGMGLSGSSLANIILQGAGLGLGALGQAQQGNANRQETAAQTASRLVDSQSQQDRQNAASAATPLGDDQKFVAKNALLQQFLGGMKNISYPQGGSSAGQGGVLPAGGLDPKMLDSLYGQQPTLASLAQHQKQLAAVNPQAPAMDLTQLGGYGAAAKPAMADIAAYQGDQATKQDAQRNLIQQYINAGLSGNYGNLANAIVGTGGKGSGY